MLLVLLTMFGPPLLFFIIGYSNKGDKKMAKIMYIIAIVYLLIGLGLCGSLLLNF